MRSILIIAFTTLLSIVLALPVTEQRDHRLSKRDDLASSSSSLGLSLRFDDDDDDESSVERELFGRNDAPVPSSIPIIFSENARRDIDQLEINGLKLTDEQKMAEKNEYMRKIYAFMEGRDRLNNVIEVTVQRAAHEGGSNRNQPRHIVVKFKEPYKLPSGQDIVRNVQCNVSVGNKRRRSDSWHVPVR